MLYSRHATMNKIYGLCIDVTHSGRKDKCVYAAKQLQSCPTLCDPIDGQPTRLSHPWDSLGKNTGVGCHFLLQCVKVKIESEVTQLCPTPSDPMDCSLPGSSIHGFSRQEYWSGLPLPSPNLCINKYNNLFQVQ